MKKIGIILLVLILAILGYYFTRPASYSVERSIEIDADSDIIWEQVSKFGNWDNWSPWKEKDATVHTTVEGTDGEVGAVSTYTSENSGSGRMTNISVVKNKELKYTMLFLEPWESKSDGFVRLEKLENGKTKVTWGFSGKNKGIMRFMNMDKMVGPDFKRGLEILKEKTEIMHKNSATRLEVKKGKFPAIKYIAIKYKDLDFDEVDAKFFADNYGKLSQSGADFIVDGIPSSIYYTWNEETKKTDMAVVLPIRDNPKKLKPGFEIIDIEQKDAYFIDFYGNYTDLENAHIAIIKYFEENDISNNKIAIEQYITDPAKEKDSSKWLTKVSYFEE